MAGAAGIEPALRESKSRVRPLHCTPIWSLPRLALPVSADLTRRNKRPNCLANSPLCRLGKATLKPCRHSSRSGEESELLLTGGSLCHKGERMSIKSKPSLIICYQSRKVNSFLVQSLYIHQLSCRAPPTVSALLTAPAHAARFHTNTGTVLKLRRFSQVSPLNT